MTPASTGSTPDPVDRAREQRVARLRIARALHPDQGGDHDTYVAAMAALEAQQAGRAGSAPGPDETADPRPGGEVVLVARRGWRWPRRLRRRLRDHRRRRWARL